MRASDYLRERGRVGEWGAQGISDQAGTEREGREGKMSSGWLSSEYFELDKLVVASTGWQLGLIATLRGALTDTSVLTSGQACPLAA